MTQEDIKYELEHSWDDAYEILYSVLNTELPNIINRLESVKDRLIAGNNKDIWNDAAKIRNYFNSERINVRKTKLEKILKELNNIKEQLKEL